LLPKQIHSDFTDADKDQTMNEFLSQSDVKGTHGKQKGPAATIGASGFFSGLFRTLPNKQLEEDTSSETALSAFVLPEPVPFMTSSSSQPDLMPTVVPDDDADDDKADAAASSADAPPSGWQRLTKGRSAAFSAAAPPAAQNIPYLARATSELGKPIARPVGRVNMLASQPKSPVDSNASFPAATEEEDNTD